ncbi:ABC transporter permease [Alkaliphilus crotonatoxidans]
MKKRYLILALVILSVASILIGAKNIQLADILKLNYESLQILFISRFPRLISIIVSGMGMALSGLIMQQITRNKFVSPTTATTVDSAKLGFLVSLIWFYSASTFNKMVIAFIFALGGTFLFMTILRKIKFKNMIFVPLIGIMLGSIIDSVTTFFAYKYDLIQSMNALLQGNFAMVIKGRYELLYLSIPLTVIAFVYANQFTVVGMGEAFAKNLGLNYNRVVNVGVVIIALISSLVVITVGQIPFLGLIIPNIVSLYGGDNLKKNLMPTALLGAVFLLFCDILGRIIIFPYEIPISLMVGVIGSVIFLYLLVRRNEA